MKRYISTGLSLPVEIAERIEKERGEISRSRYLMRMINQYYAATTAVTASNVVTKRETEG